MPEQNERALPRLHPKGASHAARPAPPFLSLPDEGYRSIARHAPWRRTSTWLGLNLVEVLRLQAFDARHLHVLDKGVKLFGQETESTEPQGNRRGRRAVGLRALFLVAL